MIIKRTITKEEISHLPKETFDGRIILVETEEEAVEAMAFLCKHVVVGIDTETKPSFSKGSSHKVALLQVATDECCFLFRLNIIGFSELFVDFFENQAVVKVGLSLHDDFMSLRKRASFTPKACVDLQEMVRPFGIQDKSLQKIYAILFARKISKNQRLSNWEAEQLSAAQKQYAATDAWTCVQMYNKLQELKRTGFEKEEVLVEEPIVGESEVGVVVEKNIV